jgi:hypothetical protein
VGAYLGKEASDFNAALKANDMGALAKILGKYESDKDYWKLMENGSLVNDGDGWLKDQNGKLIRNNSGEKIGDDGIEGGLLKILGVEVTAENTAKVQDMLANSGFEHYSKGTNDVNDRDRWYWNSSNNAEKTLDFNTLLQTGYGNTMAASVFMNGFDRLTDTLLFGGVEEKRVAASSQGGYVSERVSQLFIAKYNFYNGTDHKLTADMSKMQETQPYQESKDYTGNQHRGTDISGEYGTEMLAAFSGKVVDVLANDPSRTSGNSVILEYGFNFEDSFYSTGIQAQFMHFKDLSTLTVNQYVAANTVVGLLGNTGMVYPIPTADTPQAGKHLHYQLMGNLTGNSATSTNWNMLDARRNTFLSSIGAPNTSSYVVDQGTSTLNNYTGGNYSNYFYNTNNFINKMFGL